MYLCVWLLLLIGTFVRLTSVPTNSPHWTGFHGAGRRQLDGSSYAGGHLDYFQFFVFYKGGLSVLTTGHSPPGAGLLGTEYEQQPRSGLPGISMNMCSLAAQPSFSQGGRGAQYHLWQVRGPGYTFKRVTKP